MKNILVVDDDPEIRELLVDNLSLNPNYNVEDAEDGEEALDKAEICLFDIIITDLNMPNMNGLEFSAFVRASTINQSTPIIVISGNLNAVKTDKFQKLGIIEILNKPVTYQELNCVVERLLKEQEVESVEKTADVNIFFDAIKTGLASLCKTLEVAEPEFGGLHSGLPIFPEGMSTGLIPIFSNELYGSLALTLDEPLLLDFGTSLFGSSQAPRIESCIPIASELSLQLAEYYKKHANQKSYKCEVGTPTQLSGITHKVKHLITGPVTSVSFKIGGGHGVISFCKGRKKLEG